MLPFTNSRAEPPLDWHGGKVGRFDGYEFVFFDQEHAGCRKFDHGADSHERRSLWVGTPNGLAQYREGRFRTFTTKDRLPDNAISAVFSDQGDTLWIAAGLHLSRYAAGTIAPGGPCC